MSASPSDQPLFIVDRDWLRQGPKARKSWTGNVRNRSLYGLAIQVTQYDAPHSASRSKSQIRSKRKLRDKHNDVAGSETPENSGPCFQEARTHEDESSTPAASQKTLSIGVAESMVVARNMIRSWPENPALHPPVASALPGLEHVKGLACYLDYFLDVTGNLHQPSQTRNHPQPHAAYYASPPSATEDDVWLQRIALSSALYHAPIENSIYYQHGGSALMSTFLSQLNDKISRSDLSDATISSVSGLILSEHIKGNHQLAQVHASGMMEMVRLRGGLESIDRGKRNKIARADIIRSVDTLEPPLLPRLHQNPLPFQRDGGDHCTQFLSTIRRLSVEKTSPRLVSIACVLWTTNKYLNWGSTGGETMDPISYEEGILCLAHDLLNLRVQTAFDEVFKLCLLNYVQPMFRHCAYTQNSCERRATRLRHALERTRLEQYEENVVLWILYTGLMNSQQTSEHGYFRAELVEFLRQSEPATTICWQHMKERLKTFLWTDTVHDQLGQYFFTGLCSDQRQPAPRLNRICITCDTPHDLGSMQSA